MALDAFEIEDEGPISRAACDSVPQVMVIAGPNGVGKSTLLNALLELPDGELHGETDCPYFAPHRSPRGQNVTATNIVQMEDVTARKTLSVHQQNRSGPRRVRDLFGTNVGGNLDRSNFRREADFLPYYEVKRRLAQLKRNGQKYLEQIYEERDQVPEGFLPDFEAPFKEAVESILPGITFEGVYEDENEYTLKFTNRDGISVEFDDLSSGEKDLIAQVFIAVEHVVQEDLAESGLGEPPERDLLILIDGPESYLHPRLQSNFINFIKDFVVSNNQNEDQRSIQFVICTHSRSIIEEAEEEEIYFLFFPDQVGPDGNQLVSADEVESEQLEKITEELGPVLLSSGKDILLVEGKTDRDILNSLFPDLEASVDIVPMSGKDRVVQDTLNELIPELAEKGVDVFGLVDRDRELELDGDVVSRIQSLPATCIENLLLEPEAVYLSLRDSLIGISSLELAEIRGAADVEDIKNDIVNTDDFRQKEVSTRWNEYVNPIYVGVDNFRASNFDDIENYVESQVHDQVGQVDSQEDIRTRVDQLVENGNYERLDGKEILKRLSSHFNLNTERFALSVADKLREMGIIPDDLTNFIAQVRERSSR